MTYRCDEEPTDERTRSSRGELELQLRVSTTGVAYLRVGVVPPPSSQSSLPCDIVFMS